MRSAETSTPARTADVEFRPLPTASRLAIGAERAGRHRSAMHYLMTADVTAARRLMAMSPETLSLTGFIAASVARAVAEHPAVHAYRDWRGRLVVHHRVHVMVPVEAQSDQEPRVISLVVTDADTRDVADVSAELLAAKASLGTGVFDRFPALARIPGLVRAMYMVLDHSVWQRQRIGTVAITTAGMRDVGETFGVTPPGLMPLHVVIGSISACPHQTGNLIERHEILNLTLTFDHEVVDEAQAAEFATRLCSAIERAEVLQSHLDRTPPQPTGVAAEPRATAPNVAHAR